MVVLDRWSRDQVRLCLIYDGTVIVSYFLFIVVTVKPVLADHLRAVKKWSANAVGPLTQVDLVLKCYTAGPKKVVR